MTRDGPLTIAGGGLAGCLVALALAKLRPDVDFVLVEQGERFGGNHVWSFFDADVAPGDRWLIDPIVAASWDGYDVRFPDRARTLPTRYNSTRSDRLDALVRERLRPDQYRLGEVADGARIDIDARGAANLDALDLGWQKFVGRDLRLAAPHGLTRPIVMDACVDQTDGYRFVYCLPFSEDRLLIEDTYYSTDPTLDRAALVRILTEPRNALIKQYQRMFQIDGVELEFDDEAVGAIADQALLRGTGARGLRAIMEEVLQQVMFEVPSRDDVARVVITRDVVLKNVNPTLVPRDVPRDKRTPREKSA